VSGGPLISIAMPCYNSASLLGWALASLVAQGYEDWECIIVDDGSDDHPNEVVAAYHDERFRLIRLDNTVGRARARQVAVDAARGALLAKLDADDWLYPDKLARQVAVMQELRDVALVSTGIAIENEREQLVGVRARGPVGGAQSQPPLSKLAPPTVAHAPSMMRMEIAKRYRYNQSLTRSEDADFLIKLLMENRYCMLHDVLYTYREYRSTSLSDTMTAYRSRMKMFWMARRDYPIAAAGQSIQTALKLMIYRVAFMTGQAGALIARRSAAPTEDDLLRFQIARSAVSRVYATYVGDETALSGNEAK
jgi:glycosyltransferase involved in cell wall biosynthesis